MTALLEFGQYVFDHHEAAADPYMTVVDYFSSTRELAGMRRLTEGRCDRPIGAPGCDRAPATADHCRAHQPHGQPEDHPVAGRPRAAVQLRNRQHPGPSGPHGAAQAGPGQMGAGEPGPQTPARRRPARDLVDAAGRRRRPAAWADGGDGSAARTWPSTSRRAPGSAVPPPGRDLSSPIYHWSRPRDLAHFEQFGYEHATFGRRVEGLTTTPFSERALDRGLAGVLVGAIRHRTDVALPNLGAQRAPLGAAAVGGVLQLFRERARGGRRFGTSRLAGSPSERRGRSIDG